MGMEAAIRTLGTEAGVAWLEAHIESPCGRAWGSLLAMLNPPWHHLDRWIRMSKLHCLAAIDAILCFSDPHDVRGCITTPEGADEKVINDAVDYALAHHLNPRLENAAKGIRKAWPRGGRKRRPIVVPPALLDAAGFVLGGDPELVKAWRDSMANAKKVPRKAWGIWDSLLDFAQRSQIVWAIDHRESSKEIVAVLRALKGSSNLTIDWEKFSSYEAETEAALRTLGREIAKAGRILVCLDRGGDDYPLAILSKEEVTQLATLIDSFQDRSMRVVSFS